MDDNTPDLDLRTQQILLAASNHDLAALKPFLRIPGAASVQDPETGWTPLHAAIGACEAPSSQKDISNGDSNGNGDLQDEPPVDLQKAKDTVKELFLSGAIWNDLDANNETPGCLAWRLGLFELYQLVVEAGVRAELLMGLMGGYEPLSDDDSEDEDEAELEGTSTEEVSAPSAEDEAPEMSTAIEPQQSKADVNSADYLASTLQFTSDKLLDSDANGVMMAWETDIMAESCLRLAPSAGLRILNIGFGMGIVDGMFAATKPAVHHIIEAHPAVLAQLENPDSLFGAQWEAASEGNKVHAGKWQDIVPGLLEQGQVYDAIYFDTFGEDYGQLKMFFSEYVIGLLDPQGRFGFFNGLGADRRVCYDVYTKVVELDLYDAGLEVAWLDMPVDAGEEGKGEWEGVRRRYWTLDTYRLPTCVFMG